MTKFFEDGVEVARDVPEVAEFAKASERGDVPNEADPDDSDEILVVESFSFDEGDFEYLALNRLSGFLDQRKY